MTKAQADEVLNATDSEGFHYTFCHYSSFHEIKDKKFHELRATYLEAAANLSKYLWDACPDHEEC